MADCLIGYQTPVCHAFQIEGHSVLRAHLGRLANVDLDDDRLLSLSLLAAMTPSGLHTPSTPRSTTPSPKPSFDAETLRTYMKVLLQKTLQSATWPAPRERDRVKAWMKEIGERVKERMLGAHTLFGLGSRSER